MGLNSWSKPHPTTNVSFIFYSFGGKFLQLGDYFGGKVGKIIQIWEKNEKTIIWKKRESNTNSKEKKATPNG